MGIAGTSSSVSAKKAAAKGNPLPATKTSSSSGGGSVTASPATIQRGSGGSTSSGGAIYSPGQLDAKQAQHYNQLVAAGASPDAALQAAALVGTSGQSTAQQPTSPAPQPSQPAQQASSPPIATTGTQTTTQQQAQQQQQAGLTMPANGSVVDLLNMAGQDSSYQARQQLAQQYGIQNYSGTAAQNQELSKKFIDAHNALQGTSVPQTAADARGAIKTYQDGLAPEVQGTSTQQFFDSYTGLDPVMKQVFDVMQQTLSSINTRTSLTEEIMKLPEWQERADVKTELLDLKRIMEGTEDDIRDEITAAGGFATESQVQGLAGARNRVLLKQANELTDQWNVLNDYISAITDLTKADREQVQKDLETKLGIATTMFTMSETMKNAERENYKNIISEVGYGGLAQMTAGNSSQQRKIESLLGIAPGGLNALATYKKPLTEMEALELENKKLQNLKLKQDIGKDGENAPSKYLSLALSEQGINDINSLINAPGLNSAVGPTFLTRTAVADIFGNKGDFIASTETLTKDLTIDKLLQAKGSGATFGALSDDELKLVAGAATRINEWAKKDSKGNVTGYDTTEASFKRELDTINYYKKMNYIIEGGNPSSVGAWQMDDGSIWTQNSDGTIVQLF